MENLFRKNLTYLKNINNYTNEALSDIIGMTASSVGNLINGKTQPTATILILLHRHFKISIDDLLMVTIYKKPSLELINIAKQDEFDYLLKKISTLETNLSVSNENYELLKENTDLLKSRLLICDKEKASLIKLLENHCKK